MIIPATIVASLGVGNAQIPENAVRGPIRIRSNNGA
jgi:hypothetical protein